MLWWNPYLLSTSLIECVFPQPETNLEPGAELPSEMNLEQGPISARRGQLGLLATLLVPILLLGGQTAAQSNYVQHGDSSNYTTNGLPEEATLDGKVSTWTPLR